VLSAGKRIRLAAGASDDERFWSKVAGGKPGAAGECWLWIGAITKNGYGNFWLTDVKSNVFAHRWAYERLRGPIPTGLVIDHLCRVRHCVNPEHMEPVTIRVNSLRGMSPTILTHLRRRREAAQ